MTITPNTPVVNKGLLYVNGLNILPGALNADNLTVATILITPGQIRDSQDVNDITLPATITQATATANGNPNNVPIDANAPNYTLNSAQSGAGGLDTGTIAIDTLYAVYAIASSTLSAQPSVLLSTNFTQPLLPLGYDMFRRIGCVLTAHANARFVYFAQRGATASRDMWYAYNTLSLNAATGAGTDALTAVPLVKLSAGTARVVPITASKVFLFAQLTADAGGQRSCIFSADNVITVANGGAVAADPGTGEVIMSAAASTVVNASVTVPISSTAGVMPMRMYYALSNTNATLSLSVQGYVDQL